MLTISYGCVSRRVTLQNVQLLCHYFTGLPEKADPTPLRCKHEKTCSHNSEPSAPTPSAGAVLEHPAGPYGGHLSLEFDG